MFKVQFNHENLFFILVLDALTKQIQIQEIVQWCILFIDDKVLVGFIREKTNIELRYEDKP